MHQKYVKTKNKTIITIHLVLMANQDALFEFKSLNFTQILQPTLVVLLLKAITGKNILHFYKLTRLLYISYK